jgi:predicted phosphate transport protein (TIGR00153 family)
MRRQLQIHELVMKYMDTWMMCVRNFRESWEIYHQKSLGEEFFYRCDATHKQESHADDLRRKIEHEMYAKALLPESRGDILGILESVDGLLSQAEDVLFEIQCQEVEIPESLLPRTFKLVEIVYDCAELINKAVRIVLAPKGRLRDVEGLVEKVDSLESEADHLERVLIRSIFKLDIITGDKLVLKDVIRQLGHMCDACEQIGDRLTIVSVKRRV